MGTDLFGGMKTQLRVLSPDPSEVVIDHLEISILVTRRVKGLPEPDDLMLKIKLRQDHRDLRTNRNVIKTGTEAIDLFPGPFGSDHRGEAVMIIIGPDHIVHEVVVLTPVDGYTPQPAEYETVRRLEQ